MFCEEGECVCNNFDDNRLGDIVDNIQCIKSRSGLSMKIMIIVMMTGTVIVLITCSASNLVVTFQGRCPTLDEAITNGRLILDIFNWDFQDF